MTISPRDSARSSPFRTAETVLMKIRAFFVYGRMPEWFWCIIDRDGKKLPIGKPYLDNVLRAMTEGGT